LDLVEVELEVIEVVDGEVVAILDGDRREA
jgi:hypothetical protein